MKTLTLDLEKHMGNHDSRIVPNVRKLPLSVFEFILPHYCYHDYELVYKEKNLQIFPLENQHSQ